MIRRRLTENASGKLLALFMTAVLVGLPLYAACAWGEWGWWFLLPLLAFLCVQAHRAAWSSND